MTVHPLYIRKEEGGYRFGLPDRSNVAGHLGYEIIEGDRVIGFTSSATFFDGTVYNEGYVPRYRICAYDQKLNHTARSEVWDFGAETPAAGIGDRTFLSLHDALSAAADNDTILLLRDIAEEGLEITRNITLTNGGKTVMLLKTGDESIFRIAEGATLAVRGSENAPIVADGCGVAHRGSVFDAAGNLSLEFVQFKDLNGSSGDGTAVLFRKTGQTLTLSDCSFTDISSPGTGAAVCAEAGSAGFVNIRNCVFCDVRSAGNGGAVYLGAKGSVTQSEFLNNRAEKYSGGALFVGGADTSLQDCIFRGNYANAQDYKGGGALFIQARCTAENCTFSENSVFSGPNGGSGGAVYATSGADFLSCTFTKNKAFVGGACYIGSGAVTFEGCDLMGNTAAGTGGAVYVNWSQSAVSASFDRCHVTDNTSAQAGTIYINYYFYPGYDDWGLGQKQLDLTHSVLCGNASGGATLFTNYSWLRLNAEGSTVVASSNRKVDLKSDYEGLTITLLQDTGIDGEIVRRTDKPLGEDACEHFLLGDALAHKYFLAPGDTENSLCLRERRFQVSIENGGDSATDGTDYVYGDSFTLPNAPPRRKDSASPPGNTATPSTSRAKRSRSYTAIRSRPCSNNSSSPSR